MKNEYHDSFVNPVGSVFPVELPSYISDDSSSFTEVYGKYGKLRHTGNFSSDNPVLPQLEAATSNQDKDALYEQAVKWEIDHDTDLRQQSLNRSILEEQREYDSPLSEIARQRAAGINPDIQSVSAAGSSSGSAEMSPVELGRSATQNTTKFSNSYDNTSLLFDGLNVATNVIGAFSSIGSTVVNGITSLAALPSQISLNTAQAGLASAEASRIAETLPISKAGAALENINKTISLVGGISGMLTDNSTDDDISSFYANLGVDSESIPHLVDATKLYRSSPQLQAYYAENNVKAKKAQAEDTVYTKAVMEGLSFAGYQLQSADLHFKTLLTKLQSSFTSYLSSNNYAQLAGANVIGQQQLNSEQLKFSRKMLQHDVESFAKNIESIDKFIKQSEDYVAKLNSDDYRFQGFGIDGKKKIRPLTSEELGIIRVEEQNQLWLRSLRSSCISQAFSIARQTVSNMHQSESFVYGHPDSYINFNGVNPIKFYRANTFALPGNIGSDDFSTHNGLVHAILNEIPVVGAAINAIY